MGARTSGREAALQMLFAIDAAGHAVSSVTRDFWTEFPGDAEGRAYADVLVEAIAERLGELDEAIKSSAKNWRIERMTPVDRNILRLASYELLHRPDVPLEVIIDEAVELAKRFGADQSPSFVNGVLDNLAHECRGTERAP
jgi:N utilization substance protein B